MNFFFFRAKTLFRNVHHTFVKNGDVNDQNYREQTSNICRENVSFHITS